MTPERQQLSREKRDGKGREEEGNRRDLHHCVGLEPMGGRANRFVVTDGDLAVGVYDGSQAKIKRWGEAKEKGASIKRQAMSEAQRAEN